MRTPIAVMGRDFRVFFEHWGKNTPSGHIPANGHSAQGSSMVRVPATGNQMLA